MKKVLVAGSTGYLGRYMIKALNALGFWVRALVRNPDTLTKSGNHHSPPVLSDIDEVFQGEVTSPHTLKGICDGMDYVDFCVDSLSEENAELNVGGPQVFTHREIAGLAFQAVGSQAKITAIPAWLIKSAIYPMKIISPNNFGAIQFVYNAMTHDLAAPCYGKRDLLSYFKQAAAVRN